MGRKSILILLVLCFATKGFAEEMQEPKRCKQGEAAGYATRDATVLSMMGWGIGIAIGIAVLCALIENNNSSSSSSTTTNTTE